MRGVLWMFLEMVWWIIEVGLLINLNMVVGKECCLLWVSKLRF